MIDINFPTEKKTYLSKNNLLEWVKNAFKISIDKVEQACTGALYCQIIDSCHPGKVKMNKVNWEATFDNEYLNNYKILQEAFQECGIKKNIDTRDLSTKTRSALATFSFTLKTAMSLNLVSS